MHGFPQLQRKTTKPDEATVCFSVEELDSLEDRQKERNKYTKMKIHQRPNLVGCHVNSGIPTQVQSDSGTENDVTGSTLRNFMPACVSAREQDREFSVPGTSPFVPLWGVHTTLHTATGYLYVKPETVPKINRGEELCVSSDLYTHKKKKHIHSSSGHSLRKEDGCHSPHHSIGEQISQDLHAETYRPPPTQHGNQGRHTGSSPEESLCRESPENTECIPSNEKQDDVTETLDNQHAVFTCGECGDVFNEQSVFIVHQTTHTEERNIIIKHDRNLISTTQQGVQTLEHVSTRLRRRKHITYSSDTIMEKKIQVEPKSYMCKECGKSFTQNASLIVHKRTHTGERPHTCKVCLKSFISGSYLVMHQRVHTGERPYVCNDCGKRFISSSNLIIHQRVHTGEKPYLCTECGKCFGHSSHLVRHQKVHTGERPFTCAECGKSFSRSSHLVRHQTIHMRSMANVAL
ncbi:zinc finger protein 30-like isoform X2 [Pseudophryne corroboree]|uniref:zinc finger protein 30-like isoform X2 n=1 Tax=Pseudophryne corroboree TaxID=495146 RepID=UPI0030820E47